MPFFKTVKNEQDTVQ